MGTLAVADEAGRTIYYEHYSGDKTPVVLIHGWAMSGRLWDNVTRFLVENGHEVVVFDQRGCGRSDKDFADVSIAASVSDLMAILDKLNIDRPVLNGWSLGGAIAVETATQLGSGCRGLVLTCAATPRFEQAEDFPHGVPPGGVAQTVDAFNQDRHGFLAQLAQGICAKEVPGGVVDWMAGQFMESGPMVGHTIMELGPLDQREQMKALNVPVLNIIGSKDGVADPEVGRAAQPLLKKGQLAEFEDCGHAPFLEDFPRYSEELLRFLRNLD